MPGGVEIPFRVGEEQPTEMHGLRIFAGARLDPFFIDLEGVLATEAQEQLAFRPRGVNFLEGTNVLAIVIELDVAKVLGSDTGPLMAVVGETLTSHGHPFRLERMGRPEIKTSSCGPRSSIRSTVTWRSATSTTPRTPST